MSSRFPITKKVHKSKMYACFAFFPDGTVKRWKYVTDLNSFANFLGRSHSTWKYFNVYEKGSKSFIKRFYPGNLIPKTLALVGIAFVSTFCTLPFQGKYPLKNTFSKTTFIKRLFTKQPLINGFNNSATIPTLLGGAEL